MKNPIYLTIGDSLGIGPEITAKVLMRPEVWAGWPLVVMGDIERLQAVATELGLTLPKAGNELTYQPIAGTSSGDVAYRAVAEAVRCLMAEGGGAGKKGALVTGPISKQRLRDAGHDFQGHTEILEILARQHGVVNARAEMLFEYGRLRLLLLTRHIPLAAVPAAIAEKGAVARPIKTVIAHLRHDLNIDEPRIALLALNPHGGEVGGEEEKKYLLPVLYAVNGVGASQIDGPFAADAFFRGFDPATTPYDVIVSAYHDQGLIPFKMIAGYGAVNVTIGLPFIRTSVGHGTADDLVGQGCAREDGLVAAILSAQRRLGACA